MKKVHNIPKFFMILFIAIVSLEQMSSKAQTLTQPLTQVDLELVLAVDCSSSVDSREFDLQMVGLAKAFVHKDVVRAIGVAGNKGVAITLVQWSGVRQQVRAVDWMVVKTPEDALSFAKKILDSRRFVRGSTSTAGAIYFSANEILTNAYEGRRKIIDVSGDGISNPSLSFEQSVQVVKRGITINGLVIFNHINELSVMRNFDLVKHYTTNVIGGEGSFLMEAKGYGDFATAIRKKLVREISGNAVAVKR